MLQTVRSMVSVTSVGEHLRMERRISISLPFVHRKREERRAEEESGRWIEREKRDERERKSELEIRIELSRENRDCNRKRKKEGGGE